MKKHLRILYGCDDRFELTSNTVKVCKPYFDSIGILNSGPAEFAQRLQDSVGDVPVKQLKIFFEIESCRRAQIEDVPYGDWVMWLDADETPSPELLRNLDSIVEECETNNYDLVRFYWSEHTEGIHYPPSKIPKNMDEFHHFNSVFAARRFIKKKPGIMVSSAFGAHEVFQNINENWIYKPYAMHHMKSHLQYYQSVTFSGYMNPCVHYACEKPISDILDGPYYKSLKSFQRKTGVYTSNDLVKKLKIEKDLDFKRDIKDLFLSFPNDDVNSLGTSHGDVCVTFKFMRVFAEKYDLEVNSPYYPCGKECCKYGDTQL